MTDESGLRYPALKKRIIAIVGGFGSGKTEVSVNLAKYFAAIEKARVTIVDLDLVNPYFRSREVISELEAMGITAIAPRGNQFYADLPILMPEVKGAIEKSNGKLILDVGGDAQGTRALGSIAESVDPGDYEMLMVLNSRRPQTADVAGCMKTIERIEASARLKFTGLISNTHMIDETTPEILVEGYYLSLEVSRTSGLPVQFVSAKRSILDLTDTSVFACPVLPMTRSMLKPWERKEKPV
ncbi:MAG: cobalamin biosynthesis protein CbiA [candidate division Zixibacteria bacterium HGW-Zixibacteria-1]|nr:MAG: cobalamin biosynthesis protein CbiA [candidate division Zixibacteria bacterium HGW-Zixibacteria-1]